MSDSNTVYNMKLVILAKIRRIHTCFSCPRAASGLTRPAQMILGNSPTLHTTVPSTIIVELHLDSVIRFGIGWYFLGILPTNTEGKLGKDFSVLCLWGEHTHQRSQLHSFLTTQTKYFFLCLLSEQWHTVIFLREAGHHAPPTWFPTRLPPKKDSTNQFFHSPCRLHAQQPSLSPRHRKNHAFVLRDDTRWYF